MTPLVRDLAQRACKGTPLRTESNELAAKSVSDWPKLVTRLGSRPLVQLACEAGGGGVRIVYAADDGAIYQLIADAQTKEEAAQWIDALEKAGLDAALVSGGRKELATRRADGKLGGTEAAGGALSFEVQPMLSTWDVSGQVFE